MAKGWIKLHRDIKDHWVFDNPDYLKAWITLLIMANHKQRNWLVNDQLLVIKRGDVATSQRNLASELGWGRTRVRSFLDKLEIDEMITQYPTQELTHLSICNYDTYQDDQPTNRTTNRTTAVPQPYQQSPTTKEKPKTKDNPKNEKNDKKNKKGSGTKRVAKPYPDRVQDYYDSITDDMIKQLSEAYPNINIKYQLGSSKSWLINNPHRAKSNFKAFTDRWMRKAMEQPQSKIPVQASPKVNNYVCYVCDTKQQSSLPTWKAVCKKCNERTLVSPSEVSQFK
jgi:hypothetical protein